jgi:hypothetical protein
VLSFSIRANFNPVDRRALPDVTRTGVIFRQSNPCKSCARNLTTVGWKPVREVQESQFPSGDVGMATYATQASFDDFQAYQP